MAGNPLQTKQYRDSGSDILNGRPCFYYTIVAGRTDIYIGDDADRRVALVKIPAREAQIEEHLTRN